MRTNNMPAGLRGRAIFGKGERMSDLIDRQALLKQIDIDSDGEPGYYGDTWKFIDTIKSMPRTELSTNLAEVGTDLISRQAAIEVIDSFNVFESRCDQIKLEQMIGELPPTQPEQLEQCPIYGGMCAYPSDQCYDCPRHAGAKMGVTE